MLFFAPAKNPAGVGRPFCAKEWCQLHCHHSVAYLVCGQTVGRDHFVTGRMGLVARLLVGFSLVARLLVGFSPRQLVQLHIRIAKSEPVNYDFLCL